MNKIDLHIHSEISGDGEYPVKDIVAMCKQSGLSHFAISDHNSIQGIKDLKVDEITIIPAIELDVTFMNKPFHLLGYGIDTKNKEYADIEAIVLDQEREISKFLLKYSKEDLGLHFDPVDIEKLSKHGVVNAEMIMEACMKQTSNYENPVMKPYLKGGSRSDNPYVNYYWDYFSAGKPGYVEMHFPKMEDLIAFIHEQKGLAVLAHPGNNVKEDEPLLEAIINLGIDGIEAYSSYHSDTQTAYYKKKAEEHNLIVTCGSDFHGKTKPSISIGKHGMPLMEQEQLIEILKEKLF